MTDHAPSARPFRVRTRHEDEHHGRVVVEGSFEAAAIAYAEHMPHTAPGGPVSILVRDLHTGHEHCFRVDLDGDEAVPCA